MIADLCVPDGLRCLREPGVRSDAQVVQAVLRRVLGRGSQRVSQIQQTSPLVAKFALRFSHV
jgi:hypothetical protein